MLLNPSLYAQFASSEARLKEFFKRAVVGCVMLKQEVPQIAVDFQQVCRRGVAVRALALDPTGRGQWLARKRATSDPMNRGFAIREKTRVHR
jgi:hypothetical protein